MWPWNLLYIMYTFSRFWYIYHLSCDMTFWAIYDVVDSVKINVLDQCSDTDKCLFVADTDTCTRYCQRAVSTRIASISEAWSCPRCSGDPSQSGDDWWLSSVWPSLGRVSSTRSLHHSHITLSTNCSSLWSVTVSGLHHFNDTACSELVSAIVTCNNFTYFIYKDIFI